MADKKLTQKERELISEGISKEGMEEIGEELAKFGDTRFTEDDFRAAVLLRRQIDTSQMLREWLHKGYIRCVELQEDHVEDAVFEKTELGKRTLG